MHPVNTLGWLAEWIVLLSLPVLLSTTPVAAGEPLSVCLSRERIAVAVATSTTSLEGRHTRGDGALLLSGAAQQALQRLGAGVIAVNSPVGNEDDARALAKPLNEAERQRASWLLALRLTMAEYDLRTQYALGAPYRTVRINIDASIVDTKTRVIISDQAFDSVAKYAVSSAEGLREHLSEESSFYGNLTTLLQGACASQPPAMAAAPADNSTMPSTDPSTAILQAVQNAAGIAMGTAAPSNEAAFASPSPSLSKDTSPQEPRRMGEPARHRALIIGVSDYANLPAPTPGKAQEGLTDLQFADADARAFADFLADPKRSGADWDVIQPPLIDEAATQTNINRQILDTIVHARKDDVIILFFSGHGRGGPTSDQDVYLLPYDFDPHDPFSGISYQGLKRNIENSDAMQVIAFIDACHSGTASVSGKGANGFAAERLLIEGRIGRMRTVFASSSGPEISREFPDLGHGVFSHFLLKALDERLGNRRDDHLTLRTLADYVEQNVIAYTAEHSPDGPQHPRILGDYGGAYDTWPVAAGGH